MATHTLRAIVRQAKNILQREFKDFQMDERQLADHIRHVANVLLKGEYLKGYSDGDKQIPAQYVSRFAAQTVLVDANGVNYVLIPTYYAKLPEDMGVCRVVPETASLAERKGMIPLPMGATDLHGDILDIVLAEEWCYEVHRDRIEFTEKSGETLIEADIETVSIWLATISPADVDLDDIMPLPPELIYDCLMNVLKLCGMSDEAANTYVISGTKPAN